MGTSRVPLSRYQSAQLMSIGNYALQCISSGVDYNTPREQNHNINAESMSYIIVSVLSEVSWKIDVFDYNARCITLSVCVLLV